MKKGKRVAWPLEVGIMDNGSIVHIDYDLFNASNEKLIETTREEAAKEHELHDETRPYSPMITIVGDGRLIPGFESHLADAESGKEYNFDIEPEEAYGVRDASKGGFGSPCISA